MGEIFEGNFDIFNLPNSIPKIGSCQGIITFFYNQKGEFEINPIKPLLQRIFSHPNITLITFDFTNDLSKLFKLGFKPNMKRIFDSQTYSIPNNSDKKIITYTEVHGLSQIIRLMESECDEFVAPAKININQKIDFPWDVNLFLIKLNNLPKISMVTEKFLEYSANDIPLTALACKFILLNPEYYKICIIQTEKKVKEFEKNLFLGQKILEERKKTKKNFFKKNFINLNKYKRQAAFIYKNVSNTFQCSIEESHYSNQLITLWRHHHQILQLLKLNIEKINLKLKKDYNNDFNTFENRIQKIQDILKERNLDLYEVSLLHKVQYDEFKNFL